MTNKHRKPRRVSTAAGILPKVWLIRYLSPLLVSLKNLLLFKEMRDATQFHFYSIIQIFWHRFALFFLKLSLLHINLLCFSFQWLFQVWPVRTRQAVSSRILKKLIRCSKFPTNKFCLLIVGLCTNLNCFDRKNRTRRAIDSWIENSVIPFCSTV